MAKLTKESRPNAIEDEGVELDNITPVWIESGEPVPVVYTNHMQIMVTPWDLTLRMGVLTPHLERGFVANERIRIVWSPQHAKAALELLARQIAKYENAYGRIETQGLVGFSET